MKVFLCVGLLSVEWKISIKLKIAAWWFDINYAHCRMNFSSSEVGRVQRCNRGVCLAANFVFVERPSSTFSRKNTFQYGPRRDDKWVEYEGTTFYTNLLLIQFRSKSFSPAQKLCEALALSDTPIPHAQSHLHHPVIRRMQWKVDFSTTALSAVLWCCGTGDPVNKSFSFQLNVKHEKLTKRFRRASEALWVWTPTPQLEQQQAIPRTSNRLNRVQKS